MAIDDSEFPRVFRGYDPEYVDRTILRLRRELLGLKTEVDRVAIANSELTEEVASLRGELDQVGRPTFAGLGHTLENTLRTAEEQAARLASKAQADAYNARMTTERERERAMESAQESARQLIKAAETRAEHLLQDALTRSATIVENAERKARTLLDDATRDAADARRASTTELTRDRANAARELEQLRAEAQREFAELELVLVSSAAKTNKAVDISDEIIRIYLARGISPTERAHDREGEEVDMVLRWVPLADAVDSVLAGTVNNSIFTIAALSAHASKLRSWSTLRPADAPWPARDWRDARPVVSED